MSLAFTRFIRQPTTIQGVAVLAGAAAGVGAFFATHGNMMAASAVGGPVAGAVLMVMQDNSADKSSVEQLVNDVIVSVATKRLAPGVIDDVRAILVQPSATATATVTTTTTTAAPPAA